MVTNNKTTKEILSDPIINYMYDADSKCPFSSYGCECADGWRDIVMATLNMIAKKDPNKDCTINQIKEKFGGLRIYMEMPDDLATIDEIWKIIGQSEKRSFHICEECSSTFEVTTDYISEDIPYIRTLCINCRTKDKENANK